MVHSLRFKNQFLNKTLSILAMHLLRKIYFVGCILLLLIFLNLLFYWQIIREEDLQKNEKLNCLKVEKLRVTHQTGPLMINESGWAAEHPAVCLWLSRRFFTFVAVDL